MLSMRTVMAALFAFGVFTTAGVIGAPNADAAKAGSKGTFVGKSNHKTSGGVTIQKSGNRYVVKLASNFFLDGAPDPWVGFGRNGKFSTKTGFAVLKKKRGAQTYRVPASIDISKFNEVYIWCKKFAVPLGVARLR